MKEIKFFCDICGKEFLPKEFSFLTGQILKIDEKLNNHHVTFEGHYCGDCTNILLLKIEEIKNAQNTDT